MKDTVEQIKKMMGEPRNYGPTPEEIEEMKRKEEEEKLLKDAEEKAEKERREAMEAEERKKKQDEWVSLIINAAFHIEHKNLFTLKAVYQSVSHS